MRYFVSLFPGFVSVAVLVGLMWLVTSPWADFCVALVGAR